MKKIFFTAFFAIFFFPLLCLSQQYAPYGGPFTPRGDLRFLVVFAGFESECDGSTSGSMWPDVSPEQGNKPGGGFPLYYKDLFYSDFSQFRPDAQDLTLSNFYYQMSRKHPENPPLRIIADIFPDRINIKGSSPDNIAVFRIIQERYPDFDWSKYDNRKNNPNFRFDNSVTGPDGLIDYIIVVWRKRGAGGYANTAAFKFTTKARGKEEVFSTHSHCGFTLTYGISDNTVQIRRAFHHELAHTLFNCPHLFAANGVSGNYFYFSYGWGMMNYGSVNCSANAWECWYNGWIEIPDERDIKDYRQNGVYTLKDFITTGEAMRIKLPFTDQYLWIENHAGLHNMDNRDQYAINGTGDSIPLPARGLFLFVEALTDSRHKMLSPLSLQYANGLKALHGDGNYDYIANEHGKDPAWWNNMVVNWSQSRANPTGGHNDISLLRGNFLFDTIYPEKIVYRNYTNNSSESCRICGEKCEPGTRQEYADVIKKNGTYVYEAVGTNLAFGSGKLPQKIGLSSNPVIINHQKYNCSESRLDPILLNGISITILERGANGEITFEVKLDDTQITSHQRMTGELILNDIENAEYDIYITKKKSLTIDKSGTPNRHDKGELVNGKYEYPDFINPSSLTVENGAKIFIDKKARLFIREGSSLIIRKGGELNVRGKVKIGKGCSFIVEQGAEIKKQGIGKIILSRKAKKNLSGSSKPFSF